MPKGRGKGRKRKGPARRVTPAYSVLSEDQPGTSTAGLIPASDSDDTPQISQSSQASRPSTAFQQQQQRNILKLHTEMVRTLSDMFSLKSKEWRSICFQVETLDYVSTRVMGDEVDGMEDLCIALMKNGIIKLGDYKALSDILITGNVKAGVIIGDYTERIRQEREGPSPAKQSRSGDQGQQQSTGPSPAKQPRSGDHDQQPSTDLAATIVTTSDTSRDKKIHPDLEPMIETAKARITKEKEKKFYPTKSFCDAKEKLLKTKVVVIKGNTGDGKTAIAVQLLHWLSEEQQAGKPLQIHKIKTLDFLAPNMKLITFIDDIFGEKDASKKDVQEWNKRISDVETLFVDKQTQTNFLIITIRNEVFNSLEKRSLGTILTEDNIIDLSSHTYKLAEEKRELLELYKPKNVSWTDKEKTQILTYAPNIGFPQCCQLYYNSEELQKERVRFFENPFHFLNEALSKLKECSALLYLFLNGGMMRVKDLDPNSKKVNEKLLEEAFEINLIDGEDDSTKLTYKKKVGFVKETLEKLLGFLVMKETHWWFDEDLVVKEKHWSVEDVYRFNHDSIYVAVACLYGKATPIGYIQNCPSKSLSYLTTSKTATNMIVISSDHYTEMCERLLREFECEEKQYGTSSTVSQDVSNDDDDGTRIGFLDVWNDDDSIGSLDVWKDPVFVKRFVRLLNDRKVDKLAALNKACSCGAEECVLYLLSEGVTPNKYTRLWSLIDRHRNDSNRQVCLLRKIVVHLNDKTKVAVLNKACSCGAEECVLYLLSEGVKPDKNTAWLLLIYRHCNDSNRLLCLLRKIVVYMNDKTKLTVLDMACCNGEEECVLYLLSEGVKPVKYTRLWSLIDRHRNDSKKQVCLLRKIVVYLNDETKVAVLNGACYSGAEESVLHLLSEGAKPDKYTRLVSLICRHWNESKKQVCSLRKIVVYLNDETKVAVLNDLCAFGAEECVLYLLSEGVKPDKDTALSLVRSRHWNDSNKVCLLRKIVVYLNDETKIAVLNEACSCGAEECVIYLLSEGVKPDKETALWLLINRHWNDSKKQVCLLRKIVVYLNDETKVAVLNEACSCGAEECALYLLSEGVEPDKEIVFRVVERGTVKVLRKLLEYDITTTGRGGYNNSNILHVACECRREDMVTLLCDTYPHLVHATDDEERTPLYVVADIGYCSMFQILERFVLNSLYRVEDQQHRCESVDGRVVHRNCVCAQFMAQLVDDKGRTVLHWSCSSGNRKLCLYLCQSYPALTTAVDKDGHHCLHYIARSRRIWVDLLNMFTECETYVKQYLESTGRKYDITTILDNDGRSVLDKAEEGAEERAKLGLTNNRLVDHLFEVFGNLANVISE